jgi:large subunit ribosomal protein L11
MNSLRKKPLAKIRLTLLANRAAPSPILGQALGQYGINIMEFCKMFNKKTSNIKEQIHIPTYITIFSHNSFEVSTKTPSNTYLLKGIAKLSKGSAMTKKNNNNIENAFILLQEIYEIATLKKSNRLMNHLSIKAICKTLIGSAKSMGLPVTHKKH